MSRRKHGSKDMPKDGPPEPIPDPAAEEGALWREVSSAAAVPPAPGGTAEQTEGSAPAGESPPVATSTIGCWTTPATAEAVREGQAER